MACLFGQSDRRRYGRRENTYSCKKKEAVTEQQVVRISAEAYNALVDVYNESSLSMKELVSTIILQSMDRIVFDKEEE